MNHLPLPNCYFFSSDPLTQLSVLPCPHVDDLLSHSNIWFPPANLPPVAPKPSSVCGPHSDHYGVFLLKCYWIQVPSSSGQAKLSPPQWILGRKWVVKQKKLSRWYKLKNLIWNLGFSCEWILRVWSSGMCPKKSGTMEPPFGVFPIKALCLLNV